MSDPRFATVTVIVFQALDVPREERSSFLDRACAGDSQLRERVDGMLAHLANERPSFRTEEELSALVENTLGIDAPVVVPPPSVPDQIGRYPVLDVIGEGGMGVVYRAQDPELEREVAIKVLPAFFAADADRMSLFRREARMLATVNHPGVATIHSIEEYEEGLFLTMELVPGETLGARLGRGALDVTETLLVGRQIATALEAAHARGVIHRDLKPLNVKVTPDGTVKVLDFGLARPLDRGVDDVDPADAVGTPGYMSPEQLRHEPCDHRADIWAFGCLLHACLTGKSPFAADTVAEMMTATLRRSVDLSVLETAGNRLRALIQGCLERSVEARIDDMSAVRRSLDELIAGGHETGETRPVDPPSTPNNLRRRLSEIIGREDEVESIRTDLESHRLVTLTGVGGCGKTRLALEVAWDRLAAFPDGVWLVELASLSDADHIPTTVLIALGLLEEPGKTALDVVTAHAKDRRLLLVLDNCEHLLEPVRELTSALLEACPELRILASSREELSLSGEHVVPVAPLAIPESVETDQAGSIDLSPAVRLFMERARLVEPSLELTDRNRASVVEICRQLDGLPLALELAAARAKVLSLEELAERLDRRLDMLKGGPRSALPRHQTLRGLIEWSHELLDEDEQRVFRRLAIFAGGWSLESAEAVCQSETIESWDVLDIFTRLMEKSLVERDGRRRSEVTRFRLLETVREYAWERLEESGEFDDVRKRHRDHFLRVAERAAEHLVGEEQPVWLARLTPDHENLRRAMDTCADLGSVESGLRFAVALADYWMVRGHWDDGENLASRAVAQSDPSELSPLRGRVLTWLGILAEKRGDYDLGLARSTESLAIFRELAEPQGVARALNSLAIIAADQGDYGKAREHYEESLVISRELGDQAHVGRLLNNLGTVAKGQGDYESARGYLEESLEIRRALGQRMGMANALANLSLVAKEQGDMEASRVRADESLSIYRELEYPFGIAYSLGLHADVAASRQDYSAARRYYEESLALRREIGDRHGIAQSLSGLGTLSEHEDDFDTARTYYLQGLSIFEEIGHLFGVAQSFWVLGCLAAFEGFPRRAVQLLGASEHLFESIGCTMPPDTHANTERAMSSARESLDEDAIADAWNSGQKLSLDNGIALARDEGDGR